MHAISTIMSTITVVTTNSHMKVMQPCKSRERSIYLRAYSSLQIDLLEEEERPPDPSLPLRLWAFHQIPTKKIPVHTCNSCKLANYSEFSFSPWFFPVWVSCKNIISPSVLCVVFIILYSHTKLYSRLWCGSTV